MRTTSGWWRQFQRTQSGCTGRDTTMVLLVFPHAGSGASKYRALSQALGSRFEVFVCQYPGRQDRSHEGLLDRIDDMAAGAFSAWDGIPSAPTLAVFGHSMGAFVAFEFVRLAEEQGVPVRLLCVSSAAAPMRMADMPAHPSDDDALMARLSYLEGTDSSVLASPELMSLAIPVLRGDYNAMDRYRCTADVRVDAHIQVLAGADDPLITTRHLYEWQYHTDTEVAVTQFAGGHFYLDTHTEQVAALISDATDRVC